MTKSKLTLKILLILITVDFMETFTQFCFKKSALPESGLQVHNAADILVFLRSVGLSPFLWLGLLSVVATFVTWSTVLSRIDLSVAVPVCSFSYILVPLVSIILLHEKISLLSWIGIILILSGVIAVSTSAHKDEAVILK